MKRNQFVGGILLLIAGAMLVLFLESDSSTPVAIALMVVGIALIASGRRRAM